MTDLPYPPPWQSIATLALHLDVSETTIENWVAQGRLPAPKKIGNKRLWRWKDVENRLLAEDATLDLMGRIRDATRRETLRSDHIRGVRKRDTRISEQSEVCEPGELGTDSLPAPADAG